HLHCRSRPETQDPALHSALSKNSQAFPVEIFRCSQTDSSVVAMSQGQPTSPGCEGIYICASVRTDVWALLRRYDEALDKMSQYVAEILWRQRDFLALLSLCIQASLKQLGVTTPPVPPFARQED